LLPDVVLELKSPQGRGLEKTLHFIAAHHMLSCLMEPRRRFSDYLQLLQLGEYPFVVVALASLHGKSRQLDHPRVSDRQLRDLSDVELHVADLVWGMTRIAGRELTTLFRSHDIAAVCQHCGVLSLDVKRKYCSDGCMKAAERRRRHLRNTPSES
jgi:ribosomal protein L37E